tara:strand:+ start:888 stop:1436 length:549 start_codon:yes stop_codon:yes gene_type:complete
MKHILIIITLMFTLQSWTKADDIYDFEIDGLSIGMSILDHFSKDDIEREKAQYYKSNKFGSISFSSIDKTYDGIQVSWKTSDKDYKIVGLSGEVYQTNMDDCYEKMDEVSKELADFFKIKPDKKYSNPQPYGLYSYINFYFDSGNEASVSCYDYEDKFEYKDNFRISLDTKEFRKWIDNEAY